MHYLLSIPLLLAAVASAEHGPKRQSLPHRFNFANTTSKSVTKRTSDARFTYYDTETGDGACGNFNYNSAYTVAMNEDQYSDSLCGLEITITYGSLSTTATIQDECPGCPYGGLDLSEGLFQYFATLDTGVIYGEWEYVDSSSSGTTTTSTTWEATTSTTQWEDQATTTSTEQWQAPTTSTTAWTPTTTSTTHHKTTTTSTSVYTPPTTSTSSTTSSTSSSASPSSSSSSIASAYSSAYYSAASSGYNYTSNATVSWSTTVAVETLTDSAGKIATTTVASAVAVTTSTSTTSDSGNLEMLASMVVDFGNIICVGNDNCQ